jgi:hypothetical protein
MYTVNMWSWKDLKVPKKHQYYGHRSCYEHHGVGDFPTSVSIKSLLSPILTWRPCYHRIDTIIVNDIGVL